MASFVSVLALGGTIASKASSGGEFVQPDMTAADLIRDIGRPGLPEIRSESLFQAASGNLDFASIARVAARVHEVVKTEGACGVVVTQGTDTLEETAFLLDLLLDIEEPVVLTGALRNPALPGADGPANLLSAIDVAASTPARGLGVIVAMNEEIHAARFVRKMHSHKASAFASPAAGPLGWIAEGRVHIVLRPALPSPTIPWRAAPPDVPLVTISFSMTDGILNDYLRNPPVGMVIAALGAGHVPSWLVEKVGALAARIPVVLASRTGTGEIFRETYGYPGSETDLRQRGCIGAGYLDPLKARILLALLLGDSTDRERIGEEFSRY